MKRHLRENVTPSDEEHMGELSTISKSDISVIQVKSRRQLLQQLAVGGSLLLAGCEQRGSNTQGGTQEGTLQTHTSGQTFRAPVESNPAKTTFYLLAPRYTFATVVKELPSYEFRRFIWETGVWSDGMWVNGDIHYNWIEEPIQITPTEVSVSIRDDARWSDGHQITGRDIAVTPIANTIREFQAPYYATHEQKEPATIFGAIDDFEITKQTVTYTSSPGYFDRFWDWTIRRVFGAGNPSTVPTHIEPYGTYADAVIEAARRAQKGKINPWERRSDDPSKGSLEERHLAEREYVEKFSTPENVVTTGAWNLVEMKGSEEFIFEKNHYHRNTDAINFDSMILEYTSSANRKHAALKADRLDYGSAITPQSIVESFPDHIEELLIPGSLGTGNELGITFSHPGMNKREVRAAIMYALNHSEVANNIHQSTAIPVTTPGGDCWDVTDYVSQKWIDENLITYTHNITKAARLLREVGYTKDSGKWVGPDGEPFTLTLATSSNTPRWEPTVASQLSEFGIKTSVKTFSRTTFERRTNNGEFAIWPSSRNSSTNKAPATLFIWYVAALRHQKYGLYPSEQFEIGNFSPNGMPIPRTEERWRAFTIKAPPTGQPNSSTIDYHPASLSLMFRTNPPEDKFRNRVKTGLWLANWFLPTLPITKTLKQHFIDGANWYWPMESPSWMAFTQGGLRWIESILASGNLRADSANP